MHSFQWTARLLILFGTVIGVSSGLECWKCVGPDCDSSSMEQSEFAERMSCEDGAACQKAWLEYYDLDMNQTRKSITVRSCSYRIGCDEIIDTTDCMADKQRFAGLGCETRYCCESDLCNGGAIVEAKTALVTAVAVVLLSFLIR